MAGIYLHIPYCKQACHYCDFHFSTQEDSRTPLVEAISLELALQKNYLDNEAIETIYFGGGTPSLLNEKELREIFDSIHKHFVVTDDAEITLEANPDDLSLENLQAIRKAGVNRLSIGIQSFDHDILNFLNRAHSAREAADCVDLARKVGFSNISLDLIYAIPSQNDDLKVNTDRKSTRLNSSHTVISYAVFCLQIKNKTCIIMREQTTLHHC